MENAKWHEIYSRFSEHLNEFYIKFQDRAGETLFESCRNYDDNFDILPWVENFLNFEVTSLDPIHVFASFNYWKIPIDIRKKRMLFFCKLLKNNGIKTGDIIEDIQEINLDFFKDFPHPNITYVVSARSNSMQKEVWKFFSLIHNNDKTIKEENLQYFYDRMNKNWFGVKQELATIFMFWVNSSNFMPLDKNTLALLKKYNKLKRFPTTYERYKVFINKQNTNLYRNLAKIAINEKYIGELSNDDRKEVELFLETEENPMEESHKVINDDLNTLSAVPNLEFELYFMVNGKIKKITYEKNSIVSYDELNIIDNNDNVSYPNFQLIAIKALNDEYTKILEKNTLYYFNKNFEIEDNSAKLINKKLINLYTGYEINNINITAIVGKNGTGKSTIVELLIMALNNISQSIQSNKNSTLFDLEDLFYTIQTNYSIHSLNEKYYKGKWLYKLFHKNDAYQTPIVIEPYRENGDIKINTLDDLTKQRLLSTILDPSVDGDNKKITKNQQVTHLDISVDINKLDSIVRGMLRREDKVNKFLNISFEDAIDEVLEYKINRNIINYFNEICGLPNTESVVKSDRLNKTVSNMFPSFASVIQDAYSLYHKIAMVYICNKVGNIAKTYKIYENFKNDIDNEDYLNMLIDDKTHITFKLHQAIYFLKYATLESIGKVSINDLSFKIKNIKDRNHSLLSGGNNFLNPPSLTTIELIPPSFFKVEIILDNSISFDMLSSGEKQKIYAISSIIYHLQNIESIHRSESEYIKYSYVNIILDEIELYFHPDMQRTFIYDLLEAIQNKSGFNHIAGLNIVMVTHSPFILSDVLKSNIMYLKDKNDTENIRDIGETFGANIHTLLDNSFFMENGLMGEYAKEKIKLVLEKLNTFRKDQGKLDKIDKDEIKQIISNIGEPFLKQKLFDMYFSIFDENNNAIAMLEREKNILEEKIKKLRK